MRVSRILLKSIGSASAVAATICAGPAFAQAQPVRYSFSLPEQELGRALRAIAIRSGRSLVVPSELVAGRRSPALSGDYTAEEAVERLLGGSGLAIRRVGEALVVVPRGTAASGNANGSGFAGFRVFGYQSICH